MINKITLYTFWFLIWLFLSWPPSGQDMIIGIFVSLFVSFMTIDVFEPLVASKKINAENISIRTFWSFCYIGVFLWECLKANIDVAYRVLHPDLPIRPGTVKIKTGLRSDVALTFLANSITLTPGTTTVDIDRDNGYIYIHWLCVKEGYDKNSPRLAVVEKFERILKRIFE